MSAHLSPSHPSLSRELKSSAVETVDPSGEPIFVLSEHQIKTLHQRFDLPIPEIHRAALDQGILPLRYLRNLGSLSLHQQYILATSRVAVVGAGGLGGQVLTCLTRIGVGHLIVVDPGRFEESNLNRQVLCTPATVGWIKVQTAKSTLEELNPGVEVHPHPVRLSVENRKHILSTATVAVDALDSVQDRFVLEAGAKAVGIPLVHAAIDGFVGRIMTIFPQDEGLHLIYGPKGEDPASQLGNPPMTAHTTASLQAMEVIKLLLHRGHVLRGEMLSLELERGLLELFSFS